MRGCKPLLLALLAIAALTAEAKTALRLLGQASLPVNDPSGVGPGTEQVAFDDQEKVAYLIGDTKLYIVDLAPESLLESGSAAETPKSLSVLDTITLPTTINDVAFCGNYLAVAANGATKVLPGSVTLFSRYLRKGGDSSLEQVAQFTVGALPDQLEFSKDCRTILVANEGEPLTYDPPSLANDPEGSVSIIKLFYCGGNGDGNRNGKDEEGPAVVATQGQQDRLGVKPSIGGPANSCNGVKVFGNVRTATFTAWNDKRQELINMGVKLTGINATVAQDLEPEYATLSEDGKTAFVALQENNAMAVLDVQSATITSIHALGFKDHNNARNPLDASDRDNAIRIENWPVFGLYQPDEIKSFRVDGVDYVVTANEGDTRTDWPGLNEESRVRALANKLSPSAFTGTSNLTDNANLGRLTVLSVDGEPYIPYSDPSGSGSFEKLFVFGARSFSIWRLDQANKNKNASLSLVYDSGAQLEQIAREQLVDIFNSQGTNSSFDTRSDNKGPEPEGVAIGPCVGASSNARRGGPGANQDSRLCLFLGAERLSVIFVYDITDPTAPVFQSVVRPPQPDPEDDSTRLTGPEGLTYARYTTRSGSFPILLAAYEADNEDASLPAGVGVYQVVEA